MATLNPSKSLQERLIDVLPKEALSTFVEYMEAVKEDGYGGVCIEFDNHRPARLQITGHISKLLSRLKPRTYKAE